MPRALEDYASDLLGKEGYVTYVYTQMLLAGESAKELSVTQLSLQIKSIVPSKARRFVEHTRYT